MVDYYYIELLPFDSSYANHFGFVSWQVGVLLEPAEQITGAGTVSIEPLLLGLQTFWTLRKIKDVSSLGRWRHT